MDVRKFIIKHGGVYSEKVIEYCQTCVEVVKKDPGFEANFTKHDVKIGEFLNLLLRKAQENLELKGNEALNKKEFDKVFQNVVLYNEISAFIGDQTEHITFSSLDKFGKLEYQFDTYAIQFFKDKYKIDLSKH